MTNLDFYNLCNYAYREFQKSVPNPKTRYLKSYVNAYGNRQKGSTGNMAFNASKLTAYKPGQMIIYVDENIAPYVPYTVEKWVSPFWKGKKNPNEGWFKRSSNIIARAVSRNYNGVLRIKE